MAAGGAAEEAQKDDGEVVRKKKEVEGQQLGGLVVEVEVWRRSGEAATWVGLVGKWARLLVVKGE